jgi:protein-S-isoprenylcysteine O-methyltransferase Ste14
LGELLPKAIYFGGMVAEIIVRIPYNRRRRRIVKVDQRVTGSERVFLGGLFLTMFLLPLIYSLTSWLNFANYRMSAVAKARASGLGALLLSAAVCLFWRSHRDLGANWSPSLEISAEQTLVTQGVYGAVRHPMYASHLLWGFAQALLLHNWIAGLAGLVSFLPMYLVRIPQEERMMIDHFGDAYRAYRARTGSILPQLRRN